MKVGMRSTHKQKGLGTYLDGALKQVLLGDCITTVFDLTNMSDVRKPKSFLKCNLLKNGRKNPVLVNVEVNAIQRADKACVSITLH